MNPFLFLSRKLNLLACPVCSSRDGDGFNEFCGSCRQKLLFFGDHVCRCCGGELDGVLSCCSKCIKEEQRPYTEAASIFSYRAKGKEMILDFKAHNMTVFARIFAKMAAERLQQKYAHWEFDIIVPVPLYWQRKFSRSYNQSELFASFLAKEIHKPHVPNAISRIKHTGTQKFLSGEDRRKNLRDAFSAKRKKIEGLSILLVDDVFTTGATMTCASKALLDAGAADVYVLSIARA